VTSEEKDGSVGGSGQCLASYEGTQSRNRLADDQRAHLPCPLIGVDCFGIGHEASDVVLENRSLSQSRTPTVSPGIRFAKSRCATANPLLDLEIGEALQISVNDLLIRCL
jgi:hypothetical protein